MPTFGAGRDVLLAIESEETNAHAGTRTDDRLGRLLRSGLATVGMRELENLLGVVHVEGRDAVADGHEVVDDKRRDAGRRGKGFAVNAPREVRHHTLVATHRASGADADVARLQGSVALGRNLERLADGRFEAVDVLGGAHRFKNQGKLAVLVADQAKVRVGTTNIARQHKAVKLRIGIKPFNFHNKTSFCVLNIGKKDYFIMAGTCGKEE